MAEQYTQDKHNTVRRLPERGAYDAETVHAIIDAARICHVGFVDDGRPFVIPTLHARRDNEILLHGSKASRLLHVAASGAPLCITCTLVDGLVLARAAFNHSVNYRSAIVFGTGTPVDGLDDKRAALELFTERIVPGRWADLRGPTEKEFAATAVVSVAIETASAKSRAGGPHDFEEDMDQPVWAGVVPIQETLGEPEPDDPKAALPDYLRSL